MRYSGSRGIFKAIKQLFLVKFLIKAQIWSQLPPLKNVTGTDLHVPSTIIDMRYGTNINSHTLEDKKQKTLCKMII